MRLHLLWSFFIFILFFSIYQKYMSLYFFCKYVTLPPVRLAVRRYRRMNRRYGPPDSIFAGSTGGRRPADGPWWAGKLPPVETAVAGAYRQMSRR